MKKKSRIRSSGKRELTAPEKHLRIARDTLRMPNAMVGVMNEPAKAETRGIIRRLTGKKKQENPLKTNPESIKNWLPLLAIGIPALGYFGWCWYESTRKGLSWSWTPWKQYLGLLPRKVK